MDLTVIGHENKRGNIKEKIWQLLLLHPSGFWILVFVLVIRRMCMVVNRLIQLTHFYLLSCSNAFLSSVMQVTACSADIYSVLQKFTYLSDRKKRTTPFTCGELLFCSSFHWSVPYSCENILVIFLGREIKFLWVFMSVTKIWLQPWKDSQISLLCYVTLLLT